MITRAYSKIEIRDTVVKGHHFWHIVVVIGSVSCKSGDSYRYCSGRCLVASVKSLTYNNEPEIYDDGHQCYINRCMDYTTIPKPCSRSLRFKT